MLLLFVLALLPVVAGGALWLRGLNEKANAREAERSSVVSPEVENQVAER
ncbi:MAG TPA: hypothetical protein VGE67_17620 [Haloferula sp.]